MSHRYEKSECLLNEALKVIPLGAQTFSKSKTQFPYGISPYFVERGDGSTVWDVDGNKYIDFINALAAITLGYNDPDVTAAVSKQLLSGVTFSLSHPLELAVAKEIIAMVPSAEMVRFGKNGSDATTGAIRLARAYTGREHLAICGYHGWHDWYIGTTARNLGVPETTQKLSHTFSYNDLDSLKKIFSTYPGKIAAVIMEPMSAEFPLPGFLEKVKEITHEEGAVLVFDEVITGFRFANGGAQEYFGVTPDLTTLGKALANGYPLSAIAGRKEIMRLAEDIFFSFTFGGETLSLAAAFATLKKIQKFNVVNIISKLGEKLMKGLDELIIKYNLQAIFTCIGHPARSFLIIKNSDAYSEWHIKSFLLQEMFARGILTLGMHNMSFAHQESDIINLLMAYDEVFALLSHALVSNNLEQQLRCDVLTPLFKVR